MNGVLLIDKPKDFTSFDVIAIIRGLTKQRKIGHTGTLDPMATGVLPLLLGSSAKAQSIMPDSDKEYIAEFKLGIKTDTLDITGNVISKTQSCISKEKLLDTLQNFSGLIMQTPPMYSAVRKNGVRLYELARQGIEVEREKRQVCIKELNLLSFDENEQTGRIKVLCSKGTYIRSLIDDVGDALLTGAVMTNLRRTKACSFSIEHCVSLPYLRSLSDPASEIEKVLLGTESIFICYPELFVSKTQYKRFENGGCLDLSRTKLANSSLDKQIYRIKSSSNDFCGLGITDLQENQIKVFKMLK